MALGICKVNMCTEKRQQDFIGSFKFDWRSAHVEVPKYGVCVLLLKIETLQGKTLVIGRLLQFKNSDYVRYLIKYFNNITFIR